MYILQICILGYNNDIYIICIFSIHNKIHFKYTKIDKYTYVLFLL